VTARIIEPTSKEDAARVLAVQDPAPLGLLAGF